jgi:hypothetical protein
VATVRALTTLAAVWVLRQPGRRVPARWKSPV